MDNKQQRPGSAGSDSQRQGQQQKSPNEKNPSQGDRDRSSREDQR